MTARERSIQAVTGEPKTLRDGPVSAMLEPQVATASDVVRRSDVRLSPGTTLAAGRFTIHRTLGEGGMGVVYDVSDAERRCHVALKTLSRADPTGVYSFKNEFRFLAGLRYPNLVQLHELFAEGEFWFFTMELIDGVTFDQWVRPGEQLAEPRLRDALRQLFTAVSEIHGLGKLHCDLKPSNVLVSTAGRVVVLDFGLAAEPELGGVGHTIQTLHISGTPAYMAPEQFVGAPPSIASDYYAVGVMLFEALVGRLPFTGYIGELLAAKLRDDAPRPSSLVSALPAELEVLCTELLARDPRKRPDIATIRQRLGVQPYAPGSSDTTAPASAPLIGRERELQQLREAYDATLAGEPVIVVVTGESGIGKTSLCDYFLRGLRDEGSAVVLSGRCREQETVPFKALDNLVDELSRYLRRLPDEKAAVLLPRDSFALRRLFPVLGRVPAVAEAPPPADSNAQEVRRRGFGALSELFARVRDRQPLAVCIDDLQWTDADSVALLRHLLVDRNPVPILLVLAYRSENAENGLIGSVLDAATSNPDFRVRSLPLGPLSPGDAESLAMHLLGVDGAQDPAISAAIARESGGSPFFATELVRSARSGVDAARAAPSVTSALLARIASLPEGSQRVLELLALVGRPLPVDILWEAGRADPDDFDALRSAQLIRSREDEGRRAIECYHDRIRESVATSLSSHTRKEHYGALASILASRDDANPELLSTCLESIGDRDGASRCAVTAADHASASMAFGHAATLYQRALDLTSGGPAARRDLIVKLGSALDNAGRGKAAAEAYVQASRLSAGDDAVELRRRAAEQLLATGYIEEGFALIRTVCREVGVGIPSGRRRALASYVWNSAQLRLRRAEAPGRQARTAGSREQLRLRVASTLVTGLIGYLPIHAASSASRYLRMALDHGDSMDVIRGLGFHAYIQTLVEPANRYATILLDRMDALANENGSPAATGFASLMKGTSAYHCGRFTVARAHLASAVRSLRGCSGVDWEIDCANIYDQLIASDTGMYAHITRTTPALIDEALRRGRVWTAAMLSGFGVHAWLVPDNPSGYSAVLAEAKRQWLGTPQPRWPDFVMLAGESQQLIYQGKPVAAFQLFEAESERYTQSEVGRSAGAGIGGYAAHHGKAAAAALNSRPTEPAQALRMRAVLRASATSLRRGGGAKRTGIAGLLEAALAVDKGDLRQARSLLLSSADTLESTGAAMWAAAARRRAGQLIQDVEGATLLALGDAFMQSQGVKNVEAMTEVNCPGCRPT